MRHLKLFSLLFVGYLLTACDKAPEDMSQIKVGVITGAEEQVAEVAKQVAKQK